MDISATVGQAEDGELGPAMQSLTDKQRKFVAAVIALGRNGLRNYSQAARLAGYSDHKDRCRVTGYVLAHDARVQAAILEESKKRINVAAAVVATPAVIEIALNKKLDPKDRLKACEMLFNRGGLPAQSEHKVTVEHRQPAKMAELAERLAKELGVDPVRLLGINRAAAQVIDADFTEVEHEATTSGGGSRE